MTVRADTATNAGGVRVERPPLPIPHAHTFAELHREIRTYLEAYAIAPFDRDRLLVEIDD